MTNERSISPLIDFCSATSRQQYECGVWWHTCGEAEAHGPLPDSYFVNALKTCVRRHEFNTPSVFFSACCTVVSFLPKQVCFDLMLRRWLS